MAVYVVWSPQLGAGEDDVGDATTLIPDPRVRHYWDPKMSVGRAFAASVGSPRPAWDVWLLFGRSATWPSNGVPEAAWWEHQLSALPASRHLDPDRFAAKAAALEAAGAGSAANATAGSSTAPK